MHPRHDTREEVPCRIKDRITLEESIDLDYMIKFQITKNTYEQVRY